MKILHLIDNLSIGGAPIVLHTVIKELQKSTPHDEHVIVYIHDGPYRKKFEDLGVPLRRLHLFIPRYDPFLLPQLLRIVWQEKPDTLHAALTHSWLHGRLAGWLTRTPIVCAIHGDVTKNGRFPLLCLHTMGHLAQHYVAITEQTKETLLKEQNRFFDPARTSVVYNGIDVPMIRQHATRKPLTRTDIGLDENAFVVGSIGRLSHEKSPDILVRSFAALSHRLQQENYPDPIQLCIVGDGPEKEELQQLVKDLGIAAQVFFFSGTLNPFPYYPLFDTFVLSSQTEGGAALVLLEAMSFGVPVITTHDRPTHEQITHGVDGYYVPVNDVTAIANHLHTLATDKTKRHTIGDTGKKLVEQRYSATVMAQQYLDIFKSAAQKR